MRSMYLCADDIPALMSRTHSAEHIKLLQRFVSGEDPANTKTPDRLKDALIESYFEILPVSYHFKHKVICREAEVFRTIIDCVRLDRFGIADFDEIAPVSYNELEEARRIIAEDIKTHNKTLYNRIQMQLLCTGLRVASLVFIGVESHDPDKNKSREITAVDCVKFRIKRDNETIERIKQRAVVFGQIRRAYVTDNFYEQSMFA